MCRRLNKNAEDFFWEGADDNKKGRPNKNQVMIPG